MKDDCNMRKIINGYLIAGMVFLLAILPVCAAGNAQIVELKQDDAKLRLWVRNAGSGGEVTAMLGRMPVDDAAAQTFLESGMELHTLILIDNSLSIPDGDRPEIRDRLLELIAARRENEYYSLGTISDHVTIIQDFTKDYMQLRSALNTLEYQYQDTFLTDALYDYLLTNPFEEHNNSFERILLVSDGMDNKSLGYTKGELQGVLKDLPMPIYAIGIQNENETIHEDLENMYALTRATNGQSLLLSDLSSDTDSLITMMDADWNNLLVTVSIPESLQDGSLQTLTLQFGGEGPAVSLDNIRMPLLTEQPSVSEPEPTPEPEPEPEPTPEPKSAKQPYNVLLLAILGVVSFIAVVLAFLLLRKKKSPETDSGDNTIFTSPEPEPQPQSGTADRRTVLVGGAAAGETQCGRKTVRVLNQRPVYSVTLTDIHNPAKIYQKTIETTLTIGAFPESDICISYDSTVSGRQCELILEGDALYLVNHSHSNITELNGQVVNQKMNVASGSTIKMGLVEMRVTFQF